MKRFFCYSDFVLGYFGEIDEYFADGGVASVRVSDIEGGDFCGDWGGVKAVLWDIYGTIMSVSGGDLEQSLGEQERLAGAAGEVIAEFGMEEAVEKLWPGVDGGQAVSRRYLELIKRDHERSIAIGIEYPEVKIERIWGEILDECFGAGYKVPDEWALSGYKLASYGDISREELCWCVGYFFDRAYQVAGLYPGTVECLERLNGARMKMGVISNAQFYTPLHLRNRLREGSGKGDLELEELFCEELMVFSYEMGYSKPNPGGFEKAREVLEGMGILADEVVFVGNDMLNDVWAGREAGFKTILFGGDERQTTMRDDDERCSGLRADAIVHSMDDIAGLLLGKRV